MGLRACKECKGQVSTKAAACPHCGAKQPRRTSLTTWFVTIFFGLPIILMVIAGSGRNDDASAPAASRSPAVAAASPTANSDTSLSMSACEAAKEAVLKQLRAPATADFPGCVFGADSYSIRANPERSRFWVQGHVDSQNGFGANVRSKFIVELTRQGSATPARFDVAAVAVE